MIWQSWGHSQSTPAPGELNLADPNPKTQYETKRVAAWFDHYLRGHQSTSTGPGSPTSATGCATTASPHRPTRRPTTSRSAGHRSHPLRRQDPAPRPRNQSRPGRRPSPPRRPGRRPRSTGSTSSAATPSNSPTPTRRRTRRPGPARARRTAWTSSVRRRSRSLSAPTAAATQGPGPAGPARAVRQGADVDIHGTRIADQGARSADPRRRRHQAVRRPAAGHRAPLRARVTSSSLVVSAGSPNYRGGVAANTVTVAGGTQPAARPARDHG